MRSLAVAMLILSACLPFKADSIGNNLQTDTPSKIKILTLVSPPKSDLIISVTARNGGASFNSEMCIQVYEYPLWDINYSAKELQDHLYNEKNIEITLDNQIINDNQFYAQSALAGYSVHNENGVEIGAFSDITYCINIEKLPTGFHTTSITITSVTGEIFSDNWSFQVNEE